MFWSTQIKAINFTKGPAVLCHVRNDFIRVKPMCSDSV